jgi:hypothetical protein
MIHDINSVVTRHELDFIICNYLITSILFYFANLFFDTLRIRKVHGVGNIRTCIYIQGSHFYPENGSIFLLRNSVEYAVS